MAQAAITLVLGGQRSGKSAYAEGLFAQGGTYIATGERSDAEMQARIAAHQARRGDGWTTIEAPLNLAKALKEAQGPVLVDSVGHWVSNMMASGADALAALDLALAAIGDAPVVFVAEDVGSGVIPMNAVAREFVDTLGLVNQRLAQAAMTVVVIHAGLPLTLKDDN